jgi:uncharacterized phage protein (TIGR02218 family)
MNVVELYKIVGPDETYYWTNSDIEIEYNGDTYVPEVVSRSEIPQGEEINRQDIRLTLAADNPLAQTFFAYPPESVTSVTIFRGEDDGTNDCFLTFWKGRVASTSASDWECSVQCESIFTSLRRHGVRARYQRQCRHALYGTSCGVSASSFSLTRTTSSVSGNTVVVSGIDSFPADHFKGGYISYQGITRFIVAHSGNTLTLWRPMPELTGGQSVTVYPGCDRSLTTCNTKFANSENHGGFPWLPNVNPFKFISLW